MIVTLFHNPRCSKSRRALELLREQGVEVRVVDYQRSPVGREELLSLISASGEPPASFVRVNEPSFRRLGRCIDASTPADAIADILVREPELLQRPIARADEKVVIGRPPERCLELLEGKDG